MAETETSNIFYVPTSTLPSITPPDSYDAFRSQSVPLIIDNGSSNLRFGFSTSAFPHTSPNVIAKYKERKFNQSLLLFGDAIDAESGAKSQAKTPWEGDVLLNFDAMVGFLPYWNVSVVLRMGDVGKRVGLCVREARNRCGDHRTPYTHVRKTLLATAFKSVYVLGLVLSCLPC